MQVKSLLMAAFVAGCAPTLTPEEPPDYQGYRGEVAEEEVLRVAGFDEEEFVREAVSATTFARESSAFTLRLGTSTAVETLAQELIADQHEINTQLQSLAERKGWAAPNAMLPKHDTMLDELHRTTGLLDDRYLAVMRDALEEELLLFDRCAKLCDDRDVAIFAGTALLMIRDHLEKVERQMTPMRR
jgi:predicted outer membrane protein